MKATPGPESSTRQLVGELNRAVVWGAGGHAKVVADIVRYDSTIEVAGFLDDVTPDRWGAAFYGSRILGGLDVLEDLYPARDVWVVLGVGNNAARLGALSILKAKGFPVFTAVAPSAVVSPSAVLGAGVVLMPHAVVNAEARIGAACIINTAATVDHDCTLEAGVHIAPGAHLAGFCAVEEGAFVGIGSCVRDRIAIGRDAVIGAGSVVVSNIPARVVAYGNPARVVTNR